MDELPDISPMKSATNDFNQLGTVNFIVTNARSLLPKINSLVDYMTELDLHFALITETWFRDGEEMERIRVDLREGESLEIKYKNRQTTRNGRVINGGGVAIIHDPDKISLKEHKIRKTNYEIITATGKIKNVKRPLFIACMYIPPKSRASSYHAALRHLSEVVHQAKKNTKDPYIIIGGDFNMYDLDECVGQFPDVEHIITGPTCGANELDRVATNGNVVGTKIRQPLEDDSGRRKSDHSVIHVNLDLQEPHKFRKRSFKFRKRTPEGDVQFEKMIIETDWTKIFENSSDDPTELVDRFNTSIERINNVCYPWCTKTYKSTDAPWMTPALQKKIRNRKRNYGRGGRSSGWKVRKKSTQIAVRNAKKKFLDKQKESLKLGGSQRLPFSAVKYLKSKEMPKRWSVNDLEPDMTDADLSNALAEYFNKISSEHRPLNEDDVVTTYDAPRRALEPYEVAARIKHARKPKSMVEGDLFPDLVTKLSDVLAIPITKIFNHAILLQKWPSQWKVETVTVIPKGKDAQSFDECRNLSCTPLFSKILEGYMMEYIMQETGIDKHQYGGLKGTGTEHFLLDSWDNILRTLEDNRSSVNLITIDYSKAFNRMQHQACLNAYARKGASSQTLGLIYSFLKGRRMRVKVNQELSKNHMINGGSPQGCVSANALFCTTIQFLQEGCNEQDVSQLDMAGFQPANEGPDLLDGATLLDGISSGVNSYDDVPYVTPFNENGHEISMHEEDFRPALYSSPKDCSGNDASDSLSFFAPGIYCSPENPIARPLDGRRVLARIHDTDSYEGVDIGMDTMQEIVGFPDRWREEDLWLNKYIDDGLGGEKLCNSNAVSHFTTKKEIKAIHASKSQNFLQLTKFNAQKIGMKINTDKTKMICLTVAKNAMVNSYINTGPHQQICGSESMKILGFVFGRRPNADEHVKHVVGRFYAKIWTVRHLLAAGMDRRDVTEVYSAYIRPIIEYVNVVYHCLLTSEQDKKIEQLQFIALKIIYGRKLSYRKLLDITGLKSLQERRKERFEKFAVKIEGNERFREKWLPRNEVGDITLRKTEKYKITKSNFDRYKNGPLNMMRSVLNNLY